MPFSQSKVTEYWLRKFALVTHFGFCYSQSVLDKRTPLMAFPEFDWATLLGCEPWSGANDRMVN
ncbi:MAG: hypothetical protein NVS9B15_21600 [Acidobacteriaceae bacterium]